MKIPELNIGGREVPASEMKKVCDYYALQLIVKQIRNGYDVADEEEAFLCAESVVEGMDDGYLSFNVAFSDIMSGFDEYSYPQDNYSIPDYVNGKYVFSEDEMKEIYDYIRPYLIVDKIRASRKSLSEEELFCIADGVISLMEDGEVSEESAISMALHEYTSDSGNLDDDYYREDEFESIKTIEELENEDWD